MKRTLIGMVTFGNLEFTKLTINAIRETTLAPIEFFIVVAKPGDKETSVWLDSQKIGIAHDIGIPHLIHTRNYGFPFSINDIYDWAWKHWKFDNLILAGNDIVPYPGAIDAMIEQANTTDFEWIAASMFDVQSLLRMYPEQAQFFEGPEFAFRRFGTAAPWEIHNQAVAATSPGVETNPEGPSLIKDVRNLCLFKRSVFTKLGYADVNFWPGGYFEDNDYARRAVNAGIKSCALSHAQYFHFWSRTIHQEQSRLENASLRARAFHRNEQFYRTKWGGPFGQETSAVPFGGRYHRLSPEINLEGAVKIVDRELESLIVDYWSTQIS